MLYSIKKTEDLEKIEELVSLQNQVNEVRLRDKLGEQNFHENSKKVFEPVVDTIKNTSEKLTKSFAESSVKNNKAPENLNGNFLELMDDKGMIAAYLASSLVNLFAPENKSQFRLIKDLNSTKVNDFLIDGGITVTLISNMLTFRDSDKSFKLDGDFLETLTNYEFNVSFSNPKDQKLIYEFGKETNFNNKQKGLKSDRVRTPLNLLKLPAFMASGISTIFLSSVFDELCDILNFLLQKNTQETIRN